MKSAWRATLALAGIGLAAVSVAQLVSYRAGQRNLEELARETGVLAQDPGLLDAISREPDPWRARLRLARTLLASATSEPRPEPAVILRRLEVARGLAAGVSLKRPASWEAAMTQGASTYLEWSLRRDRRLFSHPEEWEGPLLHSLELAPGRPEPARFLAAAYLELWPALGRGKKESARQLLAGALSDRATFEALIEPWVGTAGSYEAAFSAMPPAPWAWERLQQLAAADADWPGYSAARHRWYAALQAQMRRDLAEAEARLAGGDTGRAQLMFLSLLQAPPRRRFIPQVESALAQAPPGPASPSLAPAFQSWLDWSLDLCRLRRCPMTQPVLSRLAAFAGARGEVEPARDPVERRSEWSYRDWKLLERWARLELSTDGAAGLAIEIIGAPDAGAGAEVRLDGEVVAISGARQGDVLTVRHPFDAGAHLLEIEAVSGGRLVPGAVGLLSR
ncbi:MAG TPA: hypothetical protein VNM67_21350 [Thermoanaerobaculia bacterium]|jgi:hypothetical protein|nr:hypothetical protein [Thermoanaerobaculia bacterium]